MGGGASRQFRVLTADLAGELQMPQPEQNRPVMHDFVLIVVMHDFTQYRCEVSAKTRVDACREIVHVQMAKGLPVRSIRNEE